ncbi:MULTISPECIES: dTDP-4-dehydrorhamnose 3,5-epimerase [unclassified Sphingopyxis]|jgi:dTDP-4-dehydrorhamnose 3,5-epimerase|uniref:dTDP-4-dehydrorhamnose 3,5-epimerase n=1 Tax=unclassified Sphingopyxis TaxID=2614943 RepID=UPI0025E7509F|nr:MULTISPECIES: dTDP-4-dehydrorhamnose 3,5-epimerase [unclassified Sphingopyxis]
MRFVECDIPGPLIIEPKAFGDDRGFFLESWNQAVFADAGLDLTFVQDNHSRSSRGVLRGLHYQDPNPQGKLVRVVNGRVFDVAVDIRRSSKTFGRWIGVELSAANQRMLWVPPGFAHGFLTLEDQTDFLYKCTDFYQPAAEHCVRWDDPELAIDWPLEGLTPELSAKDQAGKLLAESALPE